MKQPAGAVAVLTDPASWVDRHGDFLFRYALRRVHQAELAEDLVQEAFLGALQSRDRFAGGPNRVRRLRTPNSVRRCLGAWGSSRELWPMPFHCVK